MNVEPLPLSDAFLLVPKTYSDERGYFKEIYSQERYARVLDDAAFVQDNVSISKRGTLRGLHADPRMAKLVQVLVGEAYDVIVDLRKDSPSYLKWYGLHLRADEHTQLFIPAGFLHGFLALTDQTLLLYKQTAAYDPASEFGIAWNDPDLAIEWPMDGISPMLSPKDRSNPTLRALNLI